MDVDTLFARLLRILATALCAALALGLCATAAEARGVSRVTGVSRIGQDWQHAKLKIRWNAVRRTTK